MCSMDAQGTRRSARAAGVLLVCALASSGCVKFASELDTVAPEGSVRSLLDGQGAAPAGRDWSCTGAGSAPAASASSQAPLTYSFHLEHFITGQPLDGALVRACFRADVGCAEPLTEVLLGDATGNGQVTAYEGFNGYLEISVGGMLPTLLFFEAWSPALLAELEVVSLRLLPEAALQALGSTANVPLDPAAGVVAVTALDCTGATAGGVRLELDRGALPYAFVDDLPVINRDSTSSQGLAGFVNVPPGIVVVSGYREGELEPLGVESMVVRSGWVSSSFLMPAFSR